MSDHEDSRNPLLPRVYPHSTPLGKTNSQSQKGKEPAASTPPATSTSPKPANPFLDDQPQDNSVPTQFAGRRFIEMATTWEGSPTSACNKRIELPSMGSFGKRPGGDNIKDLQLAFL
ncbi:hypothetical protein Pst134EA_025528 [Puccinia striiformis f. sp. tritici]|uniref:hypothetical protein n=1 Tax=Puccinia striiformis f. sp. tritici TaxID=168172 RepID=UPI002008E11D|nr:hypothetical protein Pst134EA_025528 [Puccinia striiformis f. sp. tritici]KAH9451580.1 hypothetical protein Pst134EA_025528 [Puccinia striiformis f. sp. tritici]